MSSTINPKNRTIRLIVQAKKLYNNHETETDVDNYTALVEDGGLKSDFGHANKDFETMVFMNKNICWSIEVADPRGEDLHYYASLAKVVHNPDAGNPNFFTAEELYLNPDTMQICGTIARNPNLPNKDDSYTILFYVGHSSGNSTTTKLVVLDPKLKISVRQ